jgi:exodeoxyribonuclease V beta subunit
VRSLDPAHVPLVGRHLIEASAGTGKTWTITTLFVRLVVEAALRVDGILVVTFTRAATAELRDRIRQRLQEALKAVGGEEVDPVMDALARSWPAEEARDRLRAAIEDFDLAAISTIHGFCQRALRDSAFESASGFDLELVEDAGPYHRRVAQDLWTNATWQADRTFLAWLSEQLSLDDVTRLVSTSLRASPVTFLPAQVDSALADEGETLRTAYLAAQRAWRADGAGAMTAIRTSPHLDKGSYGSRSVDKHERALRSGFESPGVPFGVKGFPEALTFCAPATLITRVKKSALDAGGGAPAHPVLDALGRLADAWSAAQNAFERERVRLCLALVRDARPALHALLASNRNARFFDDLIGDLVRTLTSPHGEALATALRERFPAALVDEFQDTDPAQYVVFHRMYEHAPVPRLYLIGDPKQAIYAFRGADLHAYLDARDAVPGDAQWNLDTNHRSDGALVSAVNHVFQLGPDPFGERRITYTPVKARHANPRLTVNGAAVAPLRFQVHRSRGGDSWNAYQAESGDIPDIVASDIVRLLASDTLISGTPVEPGDIAVLVDTHKRAEAVQAALVRRRVPAVRYGQASVYESTEANDLIALLEGVAEPADLGRVRAALVTPLLGASAQDIAHLEDDEAALQDRLAQFRRWRDIWEARGFMRMFQTVVVEVEALSRVIVRPGGERVMTNLRHLAELVHAASRRDGLQPLACVAWLRRQRTRRRGEDAPDLVRLESDARAVQIITMHASKGLEYPVVYLPYLWSKEFNSGFPLFHDPADGKLSMQLHPEAHPQHEALWHAEARADRLRLAYVALTRAKHLCVVMWGPFWKVGESPLARLLHPLPGPPGAESEVVSKLNDRQMFTHLTELGAATGGAVDATWADEPDDRLHAPRGQAPTPIDPLVVTRRFAPDVRIASFSSLTQGASHDAPHDVDAVAVVAPRVGPSTLALAPFPKGARSGTAYHAVLEHLDFGAADTDEARAQVVSVLTEHGFTDPLEHAAVQRSVVELCGTPLGDGAPRLADVARHERLDELDFTLPAGVAVSPFTAGRLADVFERHLPPHLAGPVSQRMRALSFNPLYGALKGFVDLAFRHDGRWWLVDYKTNHLGDALEDYGAASVDRAMIGGDYVLQYHLYAVALARFLRTRVPGFDWDTSFGGVRYLFVRGCTPDTGPTRGVFADRPSQEMITALDAALRGEVP